MKTANIVLQAQEYKSGYYVSDDAIKYREPLRGSGHWDKIILPKEIFIEAYKKWIQNDAYTSCCTDDADDWSE